MSHKSPVAIIAQHCDLLKASEAIRALHDAGWYLIRRDGEDSAEKMIAFYQRELGRARAEVDALQAQLTNARNEAIEMVAMLLMEELHQYELAQMVRELKAPIDDPHPLAAIQGTVQAAGLASPKARKRKGPDTKSGPS